MSFIGINDHLPIKQGSSPLPSLSPSPSNCPDYDLCEKCEPLSSSVHTPSHVFLKLKNPISVHATSKPLLDVDLYQPQVAITLEWADTEKEKRTCGPEKLKRHHHHHHHHQRCERERTSAAAMSGGYMSRSKEQIRQEMKQKRKLEKKRLSGGETSPKVTLPAVTKMEGSASKEASPSQRGHGK